jgi:hypothetical protein
MIVPCYVYFLVLCRDGRYDFRVKTIFGSSLSSAYLSMPADIIMLMTARGFRVATSLFFFKCNGDRAVVNVNQHCTKMSKII